MSAALKAVTLDTIAGGALIELFQAELTRCLDNISDINTDPVQKRTITITLELKPSVKRDTVDTKVKCGSKLAGIIAVNTQLFVGKHNGKLIAVENDPRQGALFDQPAEPKPLASVSNISDKKVN